MKGRVVVITGGASGIGEACAELFHNEGAQVVVVDKDALQTSYQDLVLEGDVGDEKTVQAHVNVILKNYGRIDSLVTCPGSQQARRSRKPLLMNGMRFCKPI